MGVARSRCRPLTGTHHRTSVTAHRPRPVLSGQGPRDGVPAPVPLRTEHLLVVVVNWPSVGLTDDFWRAVLVCTPNTDSREADAMRKLTFGMNLSLDGYIAAPGDDLGWSVPSDELFQWWSDRVGATGLALYGRKLWETMSSHWPTADQQPGATSAAIEFAGRWRDMPKVVFSSTT